MIRIAVIALLAACTLRVEMIVRSVPVSAQGSAIAADAGIPAVAFALPNYGIAVGGDGGVSNLYLSIDGCTTGQIANDAGLPCESPCAMPLVNCGQWSTMRHDGCRWSCAPPFSAVTQ